MKKIALQLLLFLSGFNAFSQETIVKYLSGTDKDHTVLWDFYCTDGRKSGEWSKIPVPSNWELQGFGTYNYGHDKNKASEQGLYKHSFKAGQWQNKKVFIVFEGSMTDTHVKINGVEAGDVHQGAFYRFKYDITKLLKFGENNLLEVKVDKMSANQSVNDAERQSDFWVFGGIFRPVHLEIVPGTYIDRVAINAQADGTFKMDVYAQPLKTGEVIEAQVKTLNGKNVGKPFVAKLNANSGQFEMQSQIEKPALWSAEFPNLYQVVIGIKGKSGSVHQVKQKFGFRTVGLRKNDGLYVNGSKIILKGTNRHSFWPETGRTLSHQLDLNDVKLMKEMNNNAVRMSHYPPDHDFLNICDSLGLYVINELTGWQSKYDTEVGRKLVKELVVRDVNHPSVLMWANGNEGGWNTDLDNDYQLYDPQNRTVIHPWAKFNETNTHHYPEYKAIVKEVAEGQEVFFPTEFLHGLYDGGAGAGLDDFWTLMETHPHGAGGFIWAFVDENIIRTDKNNIYDGDGNHAPDGVLGPHREKEASFYTIKEIWSPIYINPQPVDQNFDGKIAIENRYSFTKLSQCSFKWQLAQLPTSSSSSLAPKIVSNGKPKPIELMPGKKGVLELHLPKNWNKNDVLYLTAYGPNKEELFTWSWVIKSDAITGNFEKPMPLSAKINAEESGEELVISSKDLKYYFDKKTGYINKVMKGNALIPLSNGPVLAGQNCTLTAFKHFSDGNQHIVEADYNGDASLHVKWTFTLGQPAKLYYSYKQSGDADFMGITFNFPEEKITGMKWRGRGPYRVWKNRLKGQQYGVWHKKYNNTVTGETWNYPEFKGYHAEVNWVSFESKESPFTVFTNERAMYLQVLHPQREEYALKNNNVEPSFPKGDIGFLQGISAIGTKFHSAETMGPQGKKNQNNGELVKATLWFKF